MIKRYTISITIIVFLNEFEELKFVWYFTKSLENRTTKMSSEQSIKILDFVLKTLFSKPKIRVPTKISEKKSREKKQKSREKLSKTFVKNFYSSFIFILF